MTSEPRTMSMVERLNLAITDNIHGADESSARYAALAVLVELKRPTTKMLAAAQTAWLNDPQKRTSTLWQAMIAAALSGEAR